jgi:natural product precursor
MKKLNLSGKLSLNKETIAKLTNQQMSEIEGGTTGRTCTVTCYPNTTCSPPGTESCGCTVTACTSCNASCAC